MLHNETTRHRTTGCVSARGDCCATSDPYSKQAHIARVAWSLRHGCEDADLLHSVRGGDVQHQAKTLNTHTHTHTHTHTRTSRYGSAPTLGSTRRPNMAPYLVHRQSQHQIPLLPIQLEGAPFAQGTSAASSYLRTHIRGHTHAHTRAHTRPHIRPVSDEASPLPRTVEHAPRVLKPATGPLLRLATTPALDSRPHVGTPPP